MTLPPLGCRIAGEFSRYHIGVSRPVQRKPKSAAQRIECLNRNEDASRPTKRDRRAARTVIFQCVSSSTLSFRTILQYSTAVVAPRNLKESPVKCRDLPRGFATNRRPPVSCETRKIVASGKASAEFTKI